MRFHSSASRTVETLTNKRLAALAKGKCQWEEVQNAEDSTAKRSSGTGIKSTGRAIPSAQDGALAMPEVGEGRERGGGRVTVRDTGTRAPAEEFASDGRRSGKFCTRGCEGIRGRGKSHFKIRDMFADEWCTQSII